MSLIKSLQENRSVDAHSKSVSTKTVGDKKIRTTKTTVNDGSGKVQITTIVEEFDKNDVNFAKALSTKTDTKTEEANVTSLGRLKGIEDNFLTSFNEEKKSVDAQSKSVSINTVGDKKIRTTKTTGNDGSGNVQITTVVEEFDKNDVDCSKVLSTKTSTKIEKADESNKGRLKSIEDRFLTSDFDFRTKKRDEDFKVISTSTKKYTGEDGAKVEEITEISTDGKMERTTVTTHSELDGRKTTKKSVSSKYVSSS